MADLQSNQMPYEVLQTSLFPQLHLYIPFVEYLYKSFQVDKLPLTIQTQIHLYI